MKVFVLRLKPHEDLKRSIMAFATEHGIRAGIILTCVGSVEQFNLRFANQKTGTKKAGHFEILHCGGTLSGSSCHLHLTLADTAGHTVGGHLLDGNLIYTTAEIAIGELSELEFERLPDSTYGYPELVTRPRKSVS